MIRPRRSLVFFGIIALLASLGAAPTTRYVDNTDESKAGTYTLPDALTLNNGQPVRDARTWYQQRRPQLLELFRTQVYGIAPPRPRDQLTSPFDKGTLVPKLRAVRKQIGIDVGNLLIYLPAPAPDQPRKPVPLFLCFSFTPLCTVSDDPGIRLTARWNPARHNYVPLTDSARGSAARGWPIAKIISRGYGIAIIDYQAIEPDDPHPGNHGIRAALRRPGQTTQPADAWGTIAAWAYGASCAMDCLQTDPDIDAHRIAIVGHSRLGKTALWTGASDDRFAMVIAAQSGRGGAALARRNYGESIQRLTSKYGYQFCTNYVNWASHINDMPVDSHELIDLVAPRPFYQTASVDDKHSDPLGEFLAEVAAAPVYKLLGADPLDTDQMPPLNQPIMHTLGFHYRPGRHEVSAWDWDRFLDFADLHFRHIQPTTRLAR